MTWLVCSTREVQLGETTALLVKDKGSYYAVGNKCTHYGAPLAKGVVLSISLPPRWSENKQPVVCVCVCVCVCVSVSE